MLNLDTSSIILSLHTMPAELISLMTLVICYIFIILMTKFGQSSGLHVYTSVAIIACNLQVLKAADFSFYSQPVALGTIVYASSFLASDVLTELYGASAARRSVALSFMASMLMLMLMLLTIGFKPLAIAENSDYWHFNQAHQALAILFNPSAAILTASLLAYGISQLADIYVFSWIRTRTGKSKLWLRTFLSVIISAFLDSIVFNTLAWQVFAPQATPWHELFFSYILGAYVMQLLVALLNIPVLYYIKHLRK